MSGTEEEVQARRDRKNYLARERRKKYRQENPLPERPYRTQEYRHLRHRYGLEPEEYLQMIAEQDNKCACCGKEGGDRRGSKLVVDHDHSTNKVRKLLCNRCNYIAGSLEDDKYVSVYKYLKDHNSSALARLELLLREQEDGRS